MAVSLLWVHFKWLAQGKHWWEESKHAFDQNVDDEHSIRALQLWWVVSATLLTVGRVGGSLFDLNSFLAHSANTNSWQIDMPFCLKMHSRHSFCTFFADESVSKWHFYGWVTYTAQGDNCEPPLAVGNKGLPRSFGSSFTPQWQLTMLSGGVPCVHVRYWGTLLGF